MEVKVITDTKDFQRLLNNGEGDVIASNLVVSLEDEKDSHIRLHTISRIKCWFKDRMIH